MTFLSKQSEPSNRPLDLILESEMYGDLFTGVNFAPADHFSQKRPVQGLDPSVLFECGDPFIIGAMIFQ